MCFSVTCSHSGHNPINCIIPPHMLRVMMLRGDKKVAEMARSLLKQGDDMRELRAEFARGAVPPPPTMRGAFVSNAVSRADIAAHRLDRQIHDGEYKAGLPGKLVRAEGDAPTGDEEVDRAYDGAGDVFDMFSQEFGRNSLDDGGISLTATVHHRRNYNNAFWNGEQMAYGDGDGQLFTTFTDLSVIAHEMTHAVVQYSGGLIYRDQSGALNESIADVFGAIATQRQLGQSVSEADWLIGSKILGPDVSGVALRSMKAPGTAYADDLLGQDPQPFHMDLFVNTTDDNGGVHINSGIPNHVFYLYCMYLGGNSWEKPGHVWYLALQRLNNPLATFADWADQTMEASIALYGMGSMEMVMLRRAWKLVGITV